MKFKSEKKALLTVLSKAASVTEHKNTLPILAAVRLEVVGELLVVQAYDLEVAYTGSVDGTCEKQGKTAVGAKGLVAVVASLPEGEVSLAVEKNKLLVASGDVEFRLATVAVDDFPALPEPKDGVTFTVTADALRSAFGQVAYAVSTNETRYTLNGTYLETLKDALKATTTDGHRLAQHVVLAPGAEDAGGGIIVPRKAAGVLLKTVTDAGEWKLTVSESTIALDGERDHVEARLIDGQFPDYRAVVPKSEGPGATFDRKALLSMLGRMKLVSDAVTFEVKDGRMTLSALNNEDGATASEWFAVTLDVPKSKFKLNGQYLRETLSSWSCEHVTVNLPEDELTPVVVHNGEDADSFCVIMPMRM